MKFTIEVPDYTPETGISYDWVGNYEISAYVDNGEICIVANQDGLLSLAGHLLQLAQDAMPAGAHMHLGPSNSLDEGSAELILVRK